MKTSRSTAVRFIETTGRWADAESFSGEEAWAFIQELHDDFAKPFVALSDGQLMALRNLGAALGMRPGLPLGGYGPALKRAFGEGPMGAAELLTTVRYIYGQVNGGSDFEPMKRPKVSLQPREPGERWGGPPKKALKRSRGSDGVRHRREVELVRAHRGAPAVGPAHQRSVPCRTRRRARRTFATDSLKRKLFTAETSLPSSMKNVRVAREARHEQCLRVDPIRNARTG